MFYHIFAPLSDVSIFFNVFRYVTFRSIAAFITALFFSYLIGPFFINMLKRRKAVESIDQDLPDIHQTKAGTPTMGGLIILCGLLLATFLWNNLSNLYIILMIITTVSLGFIGFIDDYLKNFKFRVKGLAPHYKIIGQVALSIFVVAVIYYSSPDKSKITRIALPFLKNTYIQLGVFFFVFVMFLIVGTSNAVNLTDGLDGLAVGTIAIATFAIGVMAYIKGNYTIASYLKLDFISEAGELTVFTSGLMGTLVGFLWYNAKPAQIFMGDTGSLPLGGILAMLAVLIKEEIFFAIVGIIFIVEALSTILQTFYFKYTRWRTGKGKRIFRCAPLHHHYEMKGLKEEKIVIRFWIVALLFAAIAFATLKLR